MNISYKEFNPSPALQPYVDKYWISSFTEAPTHNLTIQKCLPLGMAQVIIHTMGRDCDIYLDGEWNPLPDAYFVGIYKDAVTWRANSNAVLFGMNLKPECLMQLFKIPVSTLFNDYTDISNFLNRRVNTIADKMMGLSDPAVLIQIAEDFLISRLKSTNEERTYLEEATNIIRLEKGNISIDSLCKRLYVSERQLQRSFKDMLGTSPKTYTRIIRFRNAYEYIQLSKNDKVSMADISYNCGYADQAHFIRDFKEFTGITPSIVEDSNMQFCQVAPKYALS